MYAVIKTGGKQYKVAIGDKLKLELIPSDIGSKVELTDVLMIVNQDQVRIGSPVIGGASVKKGAYI
jgi:large subunit ribosomal protein L21